VFERCANCGARVFKGVTDDRGTFCSTACRTYAAYPGFCERCTAASTDVSSGGTATFNGIGTALYGSGDRCPTCSSVIKRLFFCIVFVPVIPLGKFRVKHVTPQRFFSRKIV
jgi:hypothetical protein